MGRRTDLLLSPRDPPGVSRARHHDFRRIGRDCHEAVDIVAIIS
ncbi:hypothetical protein RHOER0001_6451 [Rhodococcus erythropolis SK121]|nr:hypothetical protein RHOER0001_6451 [Rhodococcus erythropolis SK121]